jgi:hypothetical protein
MTGRAHRADMPRFRYLLAEQTSPDQLVAFLLVAIVGALVLAFLFYALVLAGLWRLRLRDVTSLTALLFPSWSQLREYAGEYALAVGTSVLLTLTVTARHDAVSQINATPLTRIPYAALLQVLPLGELQEFELRGADGQPSERAAALASLAASERPLRPLLDSLTATAVLKPVLEAGGAERAELLARLILDEIRHEARWSRFLDERVLIALALLLLVGYATWLAIALDRAVSARRTAALTDYRQLWRRLLVPAACLALLLVSGAGASDPQRLARSAVAAAGVVELDPSAADAADRLRSAIVRQQASAQRVRHLVRAGEADTVPGVLANLAALHRRAEQADSARARLERTLAVAEAALATLGAELPALRRRFEGDSAAAATARAALETDLRMLDRAVAGTGRAVDSLALSVQRARQALLRLDSLATAQAALQRRVDALDRTVSELADELARLGASRPAILFVAVRREAGYEVRPGSPQRPAVRSGEWLGVHELPPGLYWVVSPVGTDSVTLSAGAVRSVVVPRASVIGAAPAIRDPLRR